jgi:chromosomal replication initiation ATPase DnaA
MKLINRLKRVVAEVFNTTVKEIDGRSRRAEPSEARHVCFYYARRSLKLGVVESGEICKRHHTAAIYATKKVENLLTYDLAFIERIRAIEDQMPELKENL